ncbi:MAG TPA: ABC transporter ATP-binding protein [Saprospiraceae bacterium]|nr:ABC transporter ATP-binding protein [Saprospiraceae bacterium]
MSKIIRLLGYVKKYKHLVALNIICNILLSIFTIASVPAIVPFFKILFDQVQQVQKEVILKSNFSNIIEWVQWKFSYLISTMGQQKATMLVSGSIIVLFFLSNFFRYFSLYFMSPVRVGIIRDIRQKLFSKILELPLSYFSEERKGDLMSRVTSDVQEIEWSILSVLEALFREPIIIMGALACLIYISPQLTIFAFAMILIIGLVIGTLTKTLKRQSTTVQESLGNVMTIIEEALGGLRIIKGFNAEKYTESKFIKENNHFKNTMVRLLRRRDLASPLSEWLGVSIVAILIVYGSSLVFGHKMEAASFLAFLFAFFRVIDPSKNLSNAWSNVQKGFAAMERVEKILHADNLIKEDPSPLEVKTFAKSIRFDNVDFKYSNSDSYVLSDINLELYKGKSIALVGPSGAGKSTLMDLIPRFQDVYAGSIFIDGVDIRKYKLKDLRDLMGIVSQDAILFNDTIYNNIVFGQENITEDQVIAAAKIANAHDFISQTDQGYLTNVGDRGTKLSGGQRQRITIARAVLKNPPILLLDEATSALDSESERLVQQALTHLMQNRTSIVIAHRLSTIMDADEILVMRNGKIVERGTHNELMEQQGEYFGLVKLQSF